MRRLSSLQARLAVGIGLLVTVLWVAAASITASILDEEMDEIFDTALEETAQRILPLAVHDLHERDDDRDEDGMTRIIASLRDGDDNYSYVVRNETGRVLFQSYRADLTIFPPYDGPGFHETGAYRFYQDEAEHGDITISIAESLSHRDEIAREMRLGLGLPLIVIIPLSLLGIVLVTRRSFTPLRRLRTTLESKSASDLSPIPEAREIPSEVTPVVDAVNQLLSRLKSTFDAERSFAANAAHELRTPLAGAIAQAQRLQVETSDAAAATRAGEMEATLKRLSQLSERLMQLARAEGASLRAAQPGDLRPVLRLIVTDVQHLDRDASVALSMPETPVMSDIDPDAFGILSRNLIENALRHGTPGADIEVTLDADGGLSVVNDCDTIPADVLSRLTHRFERAASSGGGSGLGLAIAQTIVTRTGSRLSLHSPARGRSSGFEAQVLAPR